MPTAPDPAAILAAGLVIVSVGLERECPRREDPSGVVVINSHMTGVNRTATNDLQAVSSGTMTPARHVQPKTRGRFQLSGLITGSQ